MTRVVAIYGRVSTEHEAQLSALENQIQYYDEILKKHPDWKLYDKYIDEGITGTSINKRKNFVRMMKDAENGCFDLIITREVSRFARNTVDTLQETRKLKKLGIEVYFTEDNIWTFNDEDGELKLTIMATLAQNESKKTSQRVKAGQKISFENGVFYGTGNILGYDRIGHDMVINEVQAETVKFIFNSFLNGYGTTEIKYKLEKKGYLTSTGLKNWSPSTITRILKNPFYCGTIVYRKCFVPDFLEQKPQKNRGEVEQVVVEGTHQALISKEDFEKVQKLISLHSEHINKGKKIGVGVPKSIWSKKLICKCGSSFNKRVYHKTDKATTYCFQCYKQKERGSVRAREKRGLDTSDTCNASLVQEWKLNLMAKVIFNTIWKDKEQIVELANKLIDETIVEETYTNDLEKEIVENNKKIESNNFKLEKLLDMYLNDIIKKDSYIKRKGEIDQNIELLKIRNSELNNKKGIPKQVLDSKIKNIKQSIIDNLNWDDSISDEIIDSFVEKIVVQDDKFEWNLKYLSDIIDMKVVGRNKPSNVDLYMNGNLLPKLDCNTSKYQKWEELIIIDQDLGKSADLMKKNSYGRHLPKILQKGKK